MEEVMKEMKLGEHAKEMYMKQSDEFRLADLVNLLMTHMEDGQPIRHAWLAEYNMLVDKVNQKNGGIA